MIKLALTLFFIVLSLGQQLNENGLCYLGCNTNEGGKIVQVVSTYNQSPGNT